MIYIPWRNPEYRCLNGDHPLVNAYLSHLKPFMDVSYSHGDTTFHHTNLPQCGKAVFHFENPITLFLPISHGNFKRGDSLTDKAEYTAVGERLQRANVFTHSMHGKRSMENLYPGVKVKHIPLQGFVETPPIDSKPSHKDGIVRVLFTNSHHGIPSSLWLRGGYAVTAAAQSLKFSLTIVNAGLPPGVGVPENVILKGRISDEDMAQLYRDADIFALPSLGLHSMSAARAVANRCWLLCSDAPGFEEYPGIQVAGVRERIYFKDSVKDVLLDDYRDAENLCREMVGPVTAAMGEIVSRVRDKRLPDPPTEKPDVDSLLELF